MRNALLFGASGFVGSYLLQGLLESPEYGQVTVVARRELEITHPKLKVFLGGLDGLEALKPELAEAKPDEVFIATGTTRKKTPDQAEYYRIDHDYPVLAAKVAKEAGAKAVFVVSAIGSNPASGIFYNRTKGEADRDITALGFEHTHIFRPSIIMGERPEHRPAEKMLIFVCKLINSLLVGSWKKYRGIEAAKIARAMLASARRESGEQGGKLSIYTWEEITALL